MTSSLNSHELKGVIKVGVGCVCVSEVEKCNYRLLIDKSKSENVTQMVLGCVRCFSYSCINLCKQLCRFCVVIWTHLRRVYYMELMDLLDQLETAQKIDSLADTSCRQLIYVEIDSPKLV